MVKDSFLTRFQCQYCHVIGRHVAEISDYGLIVVKVPDMVLEFLGRQNDLTILSLTTSSITSTLCYVCLSI